MMLKNVNQKRICLEELWKIGIIIKIPILDNDNNGEMKRIKEDICLEA